MKKPANTDHPLNAMIKQRWSPRAFDATRPVEKGKLLSLLEAARWAPSCFNEQPWRYLVFDDTDSQARDNARSCLVEGNGWAKAAPVLLLSIARDTFLKNDKPNRHAHHDVGLATENLVLQAVDLGLVTHQMAGFDSEKARQLFKIPSGHTPMAMIAVGYPGNVEDLPEALRDRERADRSRKDPSELFFSGTWPK